MGVLLLNATYEAIRIIPLARAVVLVLQEQADIVETRGDQELHSQHITMPYPEVIRLKYFVKIPYKSRVPLSNRAVLNRDKFQCAYQSMNPSCLGRATTVDHVHPKAKKGKHEWTNVVAACKKCNGKKADKTLQEMGWELPFQPGAPSARTWIVVGTPERAQAWSNYLEVA